MATNSLPAPIEPILTATNDGPMLTPHEGAGETAHRERVMQPGGSGPEQEEDNDTDSDKEIYSYSTVRTNRINAPLVPKRPPKVKNIEERPKLATPAGTLTSSTEGYEKMRSPTAKKKKINYGTVHHQPPPHSSASGDEIPPPPHRGIPQPYEIVQPTVVPKKDKVFIVNMKRFILSSLGLPDQEVSDYARNICSLFGIPFYLILFGGGIALTTISLSQGAGENSQGAGENTQKDQNLYHIYILTTAVGIFFILLWLFWALAFWWSRISQRTSKYISFSLIVTLWFILYFISVAVASSLTTLVAEHSDSIFCDSRNDTKICVDSNYKIVPFFGLGGILALWTVHVCVFLANVCCSTFEKNS